jgi:hypothetical protein
MKKNILSMVKEWHLVIIHFFIVTLCSIMICSWQVNNLCTKVSCTTSDEFYLNFISSAYILLILSFITFICIMCAASCWRKSSLQ